MTSIKGSFYGRVRRTAYELWRGPDYLQKLDDETFGGGPCLLRLALRRRTSMDPQIEARAIYATLADEVQVNAVLRAVYWDSKSVVHVDRHNPPEDAPFQIPAKFVRVPIIQVHQWIKRFDGLQTSLRAFPLQEDSLPICSLRIEVDSVYSVFEKAWQVLPGVQDDLTGVWQEVWSEMGKVLQASPCVRGIEESFPCIQGKPEAYDLQAYEPLLTFQKC